MTDTTPSRPAMTMREIRDRLGHTRPDTTPTTAVWIEGDPLHEAIAAAIWDQCLTQGSILVDDPRNIAAVAATTARLVLGTTDQQPETAPAGTELRDRVAQALAADDGHPWDTLSADAQQHYGSNADAVMAVADAEQVALRAEVEGLDEALRGAISVSEKDSARLRAEVERLRTDRYPVLHRAADALDGRAAALRELSSSDYGEEAYAARELTEAADRFRRMADEAQQPEAHEHTWTSVPGSGAYAQLIGHTWTRCTTCGQTQQQSEIEAAESETFREWLGRQRVAGTGTSIRLSTTAPPVHLSKGTNAEDCPACKGTNPDYPFLCPGPNPAP
ncbi:hypothetical protein ACIBKZ_22470 [Streptomyces sp. NPDC050421]|uniref:hypothetical protein n=1 Tax=Streptomyces sp. NPDC050421 TaxID=3365613 RepID=UPI00379549EA